MSGKSGKTMVYDKSSGKTYVGNFKPDGQKTAHQQLAAAAGLDSKSLVGGSVQNNQGVWSMGQNSESLNKDNLGKCKAHGNSLQFAKQDLQDGDYYTVSQNGSVNKGQKAYDLE
jgi:hypothetical protein